MRHQVWQIAQVIAGDWQGRECRHWDAVNSPEGHAASAPQPV